MSALKIIIAKSALFHLFSQNIAFNKTVGISQKIPTVVNQSVRALYGNLCDSKNNYENVLEVYLQWCHSGFLEHLMYNDCGGRTCAMAISED